MTDPLAALAAAMLPDRWAEFQVRRLGLQHKTEQQAIDECQCFAKKKRFSGDFASASVIQRLADADGTATGVSIIRRFLSSLLPGPVLPESAVVIQREGDLCEWNFYRTRYTREYGH